MDHKITLPESMSYLDEFLVEFKAQYIREGLKNVDTTFKGEIYKSLEKDFDYCLEKVNTFNRMFVSLILEEKFFKILKDKEDLKKSLKL